MNKLMEDPNTIYYSKVYSYTAYHPIRMHYYTITIAHRDVSFLTSLQFLSEDHVCGPLQA